MGLKYKDAGVDIEAGNEVTRRVHTLVKSTHRPEVYSQIGGFSGLFAPNLTAYQKPVLVTSTDGVGTKIKIAAAMDKHDTIGIDLVAMCVNDILVQGAEPLFLLDYIAMDKVEPDKVGRIVEGIATGCRDAGAALIGGETAEMPGFYPPDHYDLAGFVVGIVDAAEIIDGSSIAVGNQIIGVGSSGLHSNGYSLVRHLLLDKMKLKLSQRIPDLGADLGEVLLTPTYIYAKLVRNLIRNFRINGIAHITGGGLTENVPRVLPGRCQAAIKLNTWEIPPIFSFIKEGGRISDEEMYRTFNMGIGLVLVVPEKHVTELLERIEGLKYKATVIGSIRERGKKDPPLEYIS